MDDENSESTISKNRALPMTFGRRNAHNFWSTTQNLTFFIYSESARKIEERNAGEKINFLTNEYSFNETFASKIFKTGQFCRGLKIF